MQRGLLAFLSIAAFALAAGAGEAKRTAPLATFVSAEANLPMPDGPLADVCIANTAVASTITLAAGSGNVTDVNVSVRITHTFADDLRVRLLHTPPSASTTILQLTGNTGGSFDGFGSTTYPAVPDFTLDDEAGAGLPDTGTNGIPLTGTFKPATFPPCLLPDTLTGVDGQDAAGTWSLEAGDIEFLDTGTLNYWALDITTTGTPTSAKLTGFSARPAGRNVVLVWRTASESETAGFNLYRQDLGREVRLNRALVRAKATGRPWGAAYRFVAPPAVPARAVTYRLESVGLDGSRGTIGIVATSS